MSGSGHFSGGRRLGKAPERSSFVQTCNLLSQYIKEKGSLRDLNLEIGGKVESLEAIVKPRSTHAASSCATTTNFSTNTGKSAHVTAQNNRPSTDPFPRFAPPLDSTVVAVEDASNAASTSKEGAVAEHPKASQLTIFYSGKVLVFDDYPPDKVRQLVSFAKKGSSQMSYGILSNTIQEKPIPTAVTTTSGPREGLPPRPQSVSSKQPVGISFNSCKEKTDPITTATSISPAVASSYNVQEPRSPANDANGSDLPIARRSSLHRFLAKRKDRAAGRGPYPNPIPDQPSKGDGQFDLNL